MNCWINLMSCFSAFASLVALAVSVLYGIKPRLKMSQEVDGKNIRIKCVNQNCSPSTIKDIRCDVVVAKDEEFKTSRTVELRKDWITGIRHNKHYVFISKEGIDYLANDGYQHIKVRILATNSLGVRKYYEDVFPLM